MRLALLSVHNKSGIVEFGRQLVEQGFTLVSTGGTAKALTDAGLSVLQVDQLTGVPEMLEGRVKTLHPAVHGGILAKRSRPDHMETLRSFGVAPIDVVAVNLYPFVQTIAKPDVTEAEAIEQIDVGGPTMIRAAAKNHKDVLPVCDPADYDAVIERLRLGTADLAFRKSLAQKAFDQTAKYDTAIAAWMLGQPAAAEVAPAAAPVAVGEDGLLLTLTGGQTLRYGENPHQAAWRYDDAANTVTNAAKYQIHQGKELSYNNLLDADGAWQLLCDLSADKPAAVVVKHTNPCGVGVVPTSIAGALLRAFDADPISAFGGILAVNRTFDISAARALEGRFLEVVLAPDYDEEALEILTAKPNLRVVTMGAPRQDLVHKQLRSTAFGVLVQEADMGHLTLDPTKVVTSLQPTPEQWAALDLAWKVVKHVKSNAIVIGDDTGTHGIGAGQMSRVDSAVIAVGKCRKGTKNLVAGSDAFFPFPDGVEALAKGGVKAIVQPGGSKKDPEVIEVANKLGIAMVMTGARHFRH
jgi:phosphoribosylaminoimidazolecarboxamide formyltransferase/IMP cyclohydrolase